MTKKDGGPAFPMYRSGIGNYDPGMTLRDWFAGMAMQALIQRRGTFSSNSAASYEIADAMIAEREK